MSITARQRTIAANRARRAAKAKATQDEYRAKTPAERAAVIETATHDRANAQSLTEWSKADYQIGYYSRLNSLILRGL